jgi:hypothetical protein
MNRKGKPGTGIHMNIQCMDAKVNQNDNEK